MSDKLPVSSDSRTEQMRITYAFWLAVVGLSIAASLAMFLVFAPKYDSKDVVAVVGLFTSVLGTLVGAFFGLQIGSAGKEKADRNAKKAQDEAQKANAIAQRALASLQPDQAQKIIS